MRGAVPLPGLRCPSGRGLDAGGDVARREGTSWLGLGVGLAAAALLLAAWVLLARGVLRSGSLATLDETVTVELRRNAKPWLTRAMQVLTWLGSLAVVLPLAAVSCALLFAPRGGGSTPSCSGR